MTLPVVTFAGLAVLAALVWILMRMHSKDLIEQKMARRRTSARLVSRADFVEGLERIPVALALTNDSIVYENPDIDASLDLKQIEEVEYDNETSTGQVLDGNALRLRSHGHTFEFVLDPDSTGKWRAALPPRRMGTAQAV
ncbi:MAG TPA: hypothetical protein VER58_08160 [Thermoanaerobaculia bacterium]|nr:hypothetical protein [Thermoanaerobaculia bacterium]